MQLTPMDILALCVTIAGEMKKPMLCAGWRKLFFVTTDSVYRQLGFEHGRHYTDSHFGTVPEDFAMDEVRCSGSEYHLQDCTYTLSHDCNENEGAGVACFHDST